MAYPYPGKPPPWGGNPYGTNPPRGTKPTIPTRPTGVLQQMNDELLMMVFNLALGFVVVVLNIVEIMLLKRLPRKLKIYEQFIFSMCISDLLFGLCSSIVLVIYVSHQRSGDSNALTDIIYTMYFLFIISSIMHLIMIACDRLFAVHRPVLHNVMVTRGRVMRCIMVIWLLAVVSASSLYLSKTFSDMFNKEEFYYESDNTTLSTNYTTNTTISPPNLFNYTTGTPTLLPVRPTGRTIPTGRIRPTGGTRPTGGMKPTGGSRPTGRIRPTGGMRPTGGRRPTGGIRPTGGMRPTGGSRPTGGIRPKRGVRPTGIIIPTDIPSFTTRRSFTTRTRQTRPNPTPKRIVVDVYQKKMSAALSYFIIFADVILMSIYACVIYSLLHHKTKNKNVKVNNNKSIFKVLVVCILIALAFVFFTCPYAINFLATGKVASWTNMFLVANSGVNSVVFFLRGEYR